LSKKSIIIYLMDQFQEWEATQLYCPRCKAPRPVRKRLLLILSDGDKYDYVCAVCGEVIGGKKDKKPDNFSRLFKIK